MNVTLITAIIGAICGAIGATLGIINTWHNLSRNKLRMKITPHHSIPVGPQSIPFNFGIEVVNLSDFAVTIVDVGFIMQDGRRGTLGPVRSMDNPARLPFRLEPRTSYTKSFWLDGSVVNLRSIREAYASTQCGHLIKGNSPALMGIIEEGAVHGG